MTAPAFQPFADAFHCMVIPEASRSPEMSSRTLAAPSKTRTKSWPSSAPPTTQCASANSLACDVSSIQPGPRFAASVTTPSVGVGSVSPLKQKSAMKVVVVVVVVAMVISPSTRISVTDRRNAAARMFGTPARKRWNRDAGA